MKIELLDSQDSCYNVVWDSSAEMTDTPFAGVFEDRRYELVINATAVSGGYYMKIGEELLDVEPRMYRSVIEFPQGMYFESASGSTDLTIWHEQNDGNDERVAAVRLFVVPTKIGEDNYRTMVADLQKVCRALIIDIVGKSRHSQRRAFDASGYVFRSHEEELRAVARTFNLIDPIVEEIEQSPMSEMRLRFDLEPVGKSCSSRGIAAMMKKGIDPRVENRLVKCRVGHLSASVDVAEHRMLKAFYRLLKQRVELCRRGIENDIDELERNRKYRSRGAAPEGGSLFEIEDAPRIRRLQEYDVTAWDLLGRIRLRLDREFWEDVSDDRIVMPDEIQFSDNVYYLRAVSIILQYLRDGAHWGGVTGSDFMTKKSSRMYEQWVLVQIVTAFEKCGLAIQTWHDVVRDCISRQFGLDFQRGTVFRARIDGDYVISIRYEPWIHSRSKLTDYNEETLCHTGADDVHWSPDVMIELIRDGVEPQTIYAIALDAKYTRNPSEEMYGSVRKYQKIRSSRTKAQVTRQIWLVYPGRTGDDDAIVPDEELHRFDPSGGMVDDEQQRLSPTDLVIGNIVACPGDKDGVFDASCDNGIRLRDVFLDFANGTLCYLRKLAKADGDGRQTKGMGYNV